MNQKCAALPKEIVFNLQHLGARRQSAIEISEVIYLDESGNIRVTLDDSGRTIGWNLNDNKHLDSAYAMTSHSSQGATIDQVFIHIDTSDSHTRALIDETLAYVATSRPRYDAQIFTDGEAARDCSFPQSRECHRTGTGTD